MRRILVFCLSIVFVTTLLCNNQYNLIGKFANDNLDGTIVYLSSVRNYLREFSEIDTTVIKNGTFHFENITGNIENLHKIDFDENILQSIFFLPEKGNIEISFSKSYVSEISGTPLNEDYQKYISQFDSITASLISAEQKMYTIKEKKKLNAKNYPILKKEQDSIEQELEDVTYSYIVQNSNNTLGEYIFLRNSEYMSANKVLETLPFFSTQLRNDEKIKKIEGNATAFNNTEKGKQFINVQGLDINKNVIDLSQYIGKKKYTLIWLWASWCTPCREMIPEVKKLHKKHKKKLNVICVSIDQNEMIWRGTIKEEKMPGIQITHEKEWSSPMINDYGIRYIPQYILIDKNGIIIEREPSSDELKFQLEKLLK